MDYKLNKKIIIKGRIKTLTGLHIGGTNSAMGIGGPDSMVVRNPIDNKPYIPGSSLKGKLRAMLDVADGTIKGVNMGQVKHGTSQNPADASVKLFGNAPENRDKDANGNQFEQRPSKVIFRDGAMCEKITLENGKEIMQEELFKNTDLPYTESKTEVVLDRITAKAMPRQIERVPAGAEFELNIVLNVFNEDSQNEQLANLERAMKLLQDDYLGGSGSRGYGQIQFLIESLEIRDGEYYKSNETKGKDLTGFFKEFRKNGK